MKKDGPGEPPRKVISLILDGTEIIELQRILSDQDAEGALDFLGAHLRGKARVAMEGG